MKRAGKTLFVRFGAVIALVLGVAGQAFAQEGGAASHSGLLGIGAGLAIGLAALGGTLGQGKAISAMLDSYGRNPSIGGKLLTPTLICLALVESLVIIAFVVCLFVLGKI